MNEDTIASWTARDSLYWDVQGGTGPFLPVPVLQEGSGSLDPQGGPRGHADPGG